MNSWCGYRSVVRCWFRKQTGQPLLVSEKPKANLEILSVWEQKCALLSYRERWLITTVLCISSWCKCFPAWYLSWARGFSWCSLVFLLLILPCWLLAALCDSLHLLWILCLVSHWVKPVPRLSAQLLAKECLVLFTTFIIPHQNHSSLHMSVVYTDSLTIPCI